MTSRDGKPRWRVGEPLGKSFPLIREAKTVGLLFDPELAAQVVAAMNEGEAREAEARRIISLFLERSTDFGSGPLRGDARRWLGLPLDDEPPAPPAAPAVPGEGTVVSACCGASMQGNNDWCCACDRFARPGPREPEGGR